MTNNISEHGTCDIPECTECFCDDEMTEVLGRCECNDILGSKPHERVPGCKNWKPLETPTPRVEIWRYNETTLTVARSDGACWNGPDTMFCHVRHNGNWSSEKMRFMSYEETGDFMGCDDYFDVFSDGAPVALYDLVAMVIERDGETYLA